jgi:PDZ domain-containing protein
VALFNDDAASMPAPPREKTPSQKRRSRGITLLIGSLILVLALAAVPSAYVIEQPGPWFDTLGTVTVTDPEDSEKKDKIPLISIDGAPTYATDGQLDLLTVSVLGNPESTPSWLEISGTWFDPAKAVVPVDSIFPPNETAEEREEATTAQMVNSQQDAIAAALTSLGYDVVVGVEVVGFSDSSPAKDSLQEGDVITFFNGIPVNGVPQLRQLLDEHGTSNPATVTYLRGEDEFVAAITPVEVEGNVVFGIGAANVYEFPFDVTIRLDDVGGPSAGLMFSLGIIDKLTPGQLTGGYHISGTGTIDPQGNVGAIGGVRQKLYGAQKAGADFVFVPQGNCPDVIGNVPPGLDIFAVSTLDEAQEVLAFITEYGDEAGNKNAESGTFDTCQN